MILDVTAEIAGALVPLTEQIRLLRAEVAALHTPAPSEPELLTIAQAARVCNVSCCTLRRWEHDGIVRSVRRGHSVRIIASSLRPVDSAEIATMARLARGVRGL